MKLHQYVFMKKKTNLIKIQPISAMRGFLLRVITTAVVGEGCLVWRGVVSAYFKLNVCMIMFDMK